MIAKHSWKWCNSECIYYRRRLRLFKSLFMVETIQKPAWSWIWQSDTCRCCCHTIIYTSAERCRGTAGDEHWANFGFKVFDALKIRRDTTSLADGLVCCRNMCNWCLCFVVSFGGSSIRTFFIALHSLSLILSSISFVAHKLIHFTSILQLLTVDGMFQGLQKKVILCLLCCFCQVVFERLRVTDDICTFGLNAGAPRWRPGDWWGWGLEKTEKGSCESEELDLICFAACGM